MIFIVFLEYDFIEGILKGLYRQTLFHLSFSRGL